MVREKSATFCGAHASNGYVSVRRHPPRARYRSRLQAGERKAQEIVYRAYADTVYTMARRVLGDAALAEEATQDTFVDMIESAHKLHRPEALGGWLRSIAVNHCLMRLRSPWFKRREPLQDDSRAVSTGVSRALDIDAALRRLPKDVRMVVWMHCVEGYTHEEIGRAFGRSASFSKSKLARALSQLRRQVAEFQNVHRRPDRGERDDPSLPPVAACAS